ncbi:hypothetical protein AB0957_17180 [Streptomyces zhihengii]
MDAAFWDAVEREDLAELAGLEPPLVHPCHARQPPARCRGLSEAVRVRR